MCCLASEYLKLCQWHETKHLILLQLKDWEFLVDNVFASKVMTELGPQALRPLKAVPAKLCFRCKTLDFWAGGFAFEDKVTDLADRAAICDFCSMLHKICTSDTTPKSPKVRFERNQSALMLASGNPLPALSIFRSPG
jgi:hypothetical protein